MPIAARDRDDLRPLADVALGLNIAPRRNDRAVPTNPECPAPTSGNGRHVTPFLHLALAVAIPARGYHGSIGAQPHGVGTARIRCSVNVSCCHADDAAPPQHLAFPGPVVPGGQDGSIGPDCH